LTGHTFLVGDALGLADVTLYTPFVSLDALIGFEIPSEYGPLRAWRERMAARPTTKLLEPKRAAAD
jgi:glutathione S-transferase